MLEVAKETQKAFVDCQWFFLRFCFFQTWCFCCVVVLCTSSLEKAAILSVKCSASNNRKAANFLLVFALCGKMLCPKLGERGCSWTKRAKDSFCFFISPLVTNHFSCWLWDSYLIASATDITKHNWRVGCYEQGESVKIKVWKEVTVVMSSYSNSHLVGI